MARARQRTLESGQGHPAYSNLTLYKKHLYKRYVHTPHLELLDRELEQVTRFIETGGLEGTWMLIVSMPPRHGKSLTVSRLYPTWHQGRNPDHRAMLTSYGATLAHKNSRFARSIMQSPKYLDLFGIALDSSSRAVDAFDIDEHEGGTDAMGVLGGATGKGAHLLIGDDLLKNREEAESPKIREKTWDAVNDDLLTRLEPGGGVVLFATRWHMDDQIGRMLRLLMDVPEKQNGPVRYLNLVALIEDEQDVLNDPLGRGLDEALWPERYPAHILKAIRSRIGPYSWASLYKGQPVPSEGGLFKRAWLTPVDGLPEIDFAARYWDLAMSAKTSADYTVGVKIGHGVDGHWYVLDVVRRQLDWGQVTQFLADVMLHDGPEVMQGIEEAGYMSRAVQDLNADSRLHGFAIYGYPVDKDKLTRALPVAAKCAAGLLHIVLAGWNRDYVDELCSFPKGAHDDQVDATSGAWAMLGGPSVTEGALNLAADTGISTSVY